MDYHTKLEAMSKGRQLTEMLRLQSLPSSGVSASLNLLLNRLIPAFENQEPLHFNFVKDIRDLFMRKGLSLAVVLGIQVQQARF